MPAKPVIDSAVAGPDGFINRTEISTHRDGKITRIEHFEKNVLMSAEEAKAYGLVDEVFNKRR